jgi:hypothetical protein
MCVTVDMPAIVSWVDHAIVRSARRGTAALSADGMEQVNLRPRHRADGRRSGALVEPSRSTDDLSRLERPTAGMRDVLSGGSVKLADLASLNG